LKNRPGFALAAILTLALGIGANAAVFTVLHAVLLAPLPYASPHEVVVLNETTRDFPSLSVTRYNYDDWRARAKSFAGMEAFRSTNMTWPAPASRSVCPRRCSPRASCPCWDERRAGPAASDRATIGRARKAWCS
jgi:hypothetical protein